MQYLCQPTYKLLLFLVICMKKKIAIIDYDVGNVKSVQNAIETVGSCSSIITKNPIQIAESDCIILPGVGAFGAAMDALESSGLIQIIFDEVFEKNKPLLGICVGFQILFENSEEGNRKGLGWLPGNVIHFKEEYNISIPHFGWNEIVINNNNWLFDGIEKNSSFYFAHSYHAVLDKSITVATCNHGYNFPVFVRKKNIFASQFHPEKSHNSGLKLLENFSKNVKDN